MLLVGDGIPEIFEGEGLPVLEVLPGHISGFRAVPVVQPSGMAGPMFGGNFVYSSDSRLPREPIPVHDRYEK